jgi:hypothetical protein
MTVFEQLELLPLAYLVVLTWVVGANLIAKLLGPTLIESTSGPVKKVLGKDLRIQVTGDNIHQHIFERALISSLNTQILFHLVGDLARLTGGTLIQPVLLLSHRAPKAMYPEKYWSGCPPNLL